MIFTIEIDRPRGLVVLSCPDCGEQLVIVSHGDDVDTDDLVGHVEACKG